jgi:hypothetical protein
MKQILPQKMYYDDFDLGLDILIKSLRSLASIVSRGQKLRRDLIDAETKKKWVTLTTEHVSEKAT